MGQKELISGTCWIALKNGTLEVIIDKYRIYLQHLANLTQDNSYPAKERKKFAGWYKKCRSMYSLSGLFEFLSLGVTASKIVVKNFPKQKYGHG